MAGSRERCAASRGWASRTGASPRTSTYPSKGAEQHSETGVLLSDLLPVDALATPPHPRLVVPGDVKGGRYVSDLVDLHVTRVG
jgi:hypothetical protein